ncbi:hypothetical protein DPMN_126315 [Dreissena polymorpha]|uniref:Uncharacterized protein n=1 Tax=Dreissena polymorpha TaxID=45954 RepID=A0A9D4JVH4_DREPO|nr:hypothetical protein DPMN_126230 [Dreissena polymorpha]KAH3824479.1 hypothetical protein DPMN_126315 [Dreissena polymorpha]
MPLQLRQENFYSFRLHRALSLVVHLLIPSSDPLALQLLKENYDFFPLDRALSLAAMGQDSTEAKIDDLLFQVTSIVDKQKREASVQ